MEERQKKLNTILMSMKQLVFTLFTAVLFLTSEAAAQQMTVAPQEGIWDSNPLPEEQDKQFTLLSVLPSSSINLLGLFKG